MSKIEKQDAKPVTKRAAKKVVGAPVRTEPSDRQKRLLSAFGGVGKKVELKVLGNIAFKRERPETKRYSWARNNVRWLVANKFVKKDEPGIYVRLK